MTLLETDSPAPDDPQVDPPLGAGGPRLERRWVGGSLLFTLCVLVATVVTVYLVVPERHNALMEAAFEAHGQQQSFELERPQRSELRAWSLALLGRNVPWPEDREGLEILGARSSSVLDRRVGIVVYRVDGQRVTVLVQRPHQAVPQDYRREQAGLLCVSWRRHKIRFVAVGPLGSSRWRELLAAPR